MKTIVGFMLLSWAFWSWALWASTALSQPKVVASMPSSKESFEDAVSRILSRSTAIAAQESRLSSARARTLPRYFAFAPGFNLVARKTYTGGPVADAETRSWEAVADMNLFRFGADYAALKASKSDVDAQDSLLNDTIIDTELQSVTALATWIERRQQVDVNTQLARTQEELYRIAQERYRSGYLPNQEVEKVGIDLENARSQLADAQVQEAGASATLAALLGSEPKDALNPVWPWQSYLASNDARELSRVPFQLAERPDWKAATSAVEAEDLRYSRDIRRLLPSLDATFSYGNRMQTLPTIGDFGGTGWVGMIAVTWAIFDHFENVTTARTQAYARTVAETVQEQSARDARSEWDSSRTAYDIALVSAVSRQRMVETSRRLYQDNLRRFRMGRASANELSVDQNRLFQAELFAVQGWSLAHQAYARLCHALGRRLESCGKPAAASPRS